jgi:hypothetical protein
LLPPKLPPSNTRKRPPRQRLSRVLGILSS